MKSKYLFIFLFFLFGIILLSTNINALESLKPAKVGENYTIIQACADATYINFSLSNINGILISNQPMTANGSGVFIYNYVPLKDTRYDFIGISDGCEQTFSTYFYATANGLVQTTSQGIASAGYLFLMIALMILFIYLGFKLGDNKTLWIFGILFLFFAVLLAIYNVWLGVEYTRVYAGIQDTSMPETIFWIFMFIIVIGFLFSATLLFLRWKEIFKYIKREIKKKDEEDKDVEDWDIDTWGGKDYGR